MTVNAYERNLQARADCVSHYGAACSVCGLTLEERYGPIAQTRRTHAKAPRARMKAIDYPFTKTINAGAVFRG